VVAAAFARGWVAPCRASPPRKGRAASPVSGTGREAAGAAASASGSWPWPPAACPVLWPAPGPGSIRPPKSGWRSQSAGVQLQWSWLRPSPLRLQRAARCHHCSGRSGALAVKSCGRRRKTRGGEVRSVASAVGSAAAGVSSQWLCSLSRQVTALQRCPGLWDTRALDCV